MYSKFKNSMPFILCITAVFFLFLIFSFQKKGTFVDEMLTYDLSNRQSDRVVFLINYLKDTSISDKASTLTDIKENGWEHSAIYKEYKTYEAASVTDSIWKSPDYFFDALTAGVNSRFDFLSVMYNAVYDSHPPFYYLMIHFISSFFPGVFSLWFALSINIIFLTLTCALLFHITKEFFGGTKYAVLVTLLYALSVGCISTLHILRMYALFTSLVLGFLAVNLHLAKKGFVFNKKLRFLFIFTAVLGVYTQYFFVIYAFFLVGTVVVFLIIQKNKRRLVVPYFINSLIAGCVSLVLFPFSIKNIFFDSFGQSTLKNVTSGHYLQKFFSFFQLVIDNIFINTTVFVICMLILASAAGIYLYQSLKDPLAPSFIVSPVSIRERPYLLLLFVPAIFYFIMVSISAPFISDRYLMCLFPLLILMFYYLLKIALGSFGKKSYLLIFCISLVFTVTEQLTTNPKYSYHNQTEKKALLHQADETLCVYVVDQALWKYKTCLVEMSQLKATAIIAQEQIKTLSLSAPSPDSYERVVVCIDFSLDQEKILTGIAAQLHLDPTTAYALPRDNDEYATMYLLMK